MISCAVTSDERAVDAAGEARRLSVGALAVACAAEIAGHGNGQPAREAYCLELFRRALCERDERAWEAIITQYGGLVHAWLRRHPAWPVVGDDAGDWTYRAFERFWTAITPARFPSFANAATLLRYLKLCAHSVLLDECRIRHTNRSGALYEETLTMEGPEVERTLLGTVAGEELWAVINDAIKDEPERLVASLCLAQEMKPRELYARHPDRFASVADVYAAKRNLLDRLSRNPAIVAFLQ